MSLITEQKPALPAAAVPEALLESLNARYAVKRFDPSKKVPEKVWDALLQSLVLAPSSYGLQPWKFFVIEDPALRRRLQAASWGQSQVVDADKLVVFGVRKDFGAADIERLIARAAEVRGVSVRELDGYKSMMMGLLERSSEELAAWAARQVYIALGVFLTGAAALGVDACPMEGFEPAQYDALLGLPEKGYRAVVAAAAGCRSPQDAAAAQPKVRYERTQVIEAL